MPVFQPIVNSQPTPVAARRPVTPAVDMPSPGFLETGISGLLGVAGAAAKGYMSSQGEPKEPTKFDKQVAGLQEFESQVAQASQVRELDPAKADTLVRNAILSLNKNHLLNTSDSNVAEILNTYSFGTEVGISKEFQQEQALRESPEFARKLLAAPEGLTPEEADEWAMAKAREEITIRNGIDSGTLGATLKVTEFQTRINDYTVGIRRTLQAFAESDVVPPKEAFEQLDALMQQVQAESLQALVGADDDARARTKISLDGLRLMVSEAKTKYSEESLRNVNIQGWLRAIEEAKDQMDPQQYEIVKTTFLQMDPSTWSKLVTDSDQFVDLQGALRVLRLFKPDEVGDHVNDPKVPSAVLGGRQEVRAGDVSAATGIAQLHSRLVRGDPASVVNKDRRELAARSLSSIANYIGKAIENGNYLTPELIDQTFSKESVSYFNEIMKNDPELARAIRGEFIDNIASYTAVADAQLSQLEAVGLRIEDDKIVFDLDNILKSIGQEKTPAIVTAFEEIAPQLYPDGDYTSDGANKLRIWVHTEPRFRKDVEGKGSIMKAIEGIVSSEVMKNTKDFQAILTSRNLLEERYRGFKQEILKVPPVSEQDVTRYSTLLPLIDKHEGGGSYDKLWGNAELNHPDFKHIRVSKMTIDQASEFSRGKYLQHVKGTNDGVASSPMGRYQIVGRTLRSVKEELGLTGQELFDEDMQDRMFVYLVKNRLKSSTTLQGKLNGLRKEWAGLKDASDEELEAIIAGL